LTPEEGPVAPPANLRELFFGFLSIGARSFGGVLPWAYRTMIEERRWLTQEDFAATIGLCQFLPGPNIGNASVVLGKRWFGLKGAIVAFLGLFALPFFWVMALGILYMEWASDPLVRAVVTGVGATGAGLFMGTSIKLGRALVRKPAALVLIAACFLAVGIGRLSLVIVMPLAAALGVVAARRGWL
jgi:chromate transporter